MRNQMMGKFGLGSRVILKPYIEVFHFQETPRFSLGPVLSKLKRERTYGVVKKLDTSLGAVAVHFPGMKEFMWFKDYELEYA